MGKIPDSAIERFAKLATQLAEKDDSKSPHREGFGTGSLFVGRKMFGVLDESGALVLKLPPARVQALIAWGWEPPGIPGRANR
jgi:hypothetical protein